MSNLQQLHEEWKDIPNYEGIYQASSLGRIKRVRGSYCSHDRLVRQFKNSRGYFKVILSKGDKTKNHLVHRIIAEVFVDNPFGYTVVNHINMVQDDNRATNLEWCTQKMNLHRTKTRRGKLGCG